jgi:hypothetical protein
MQGHHRRFRLGLYVLATGGLFVALLGFILQNSFDRARADVLHPVHART